MSDRENLARIVAAMVIVALACPGAMAAGALLGCASQGFDTKCALDGFMFSPFILIGSGIVAALLVSGWGGAGLTFIAVAVGMTLILIWSAIEGRLVPIDLFSAVIATIWFAAPVLLGYGIGRLGVTVARRVRT